MRIEDWKDMKGERLEALRKHLQEHGGECESVEDLLVSMLDDVLDLWEDAHKQDLCEACGDADSYEVEQDPREVALWEAHDKAGRLAFSKKRWESANVGWGTSEDSIASKVYGRKPKVLVSSYEGDEIVHRVEDYRR